MKLGIFALQGAFAEHAAMLDKLGKEYQFIRNKGDIEQGFDGLILPGGESTTMTKLLHELDMLESVKALIQEGTPTFGTCAGMILLAKRIEHEGSGCLGAMDVSVQRNAYGRQLGSFSTRARFEGLGDIPMVFIRAPYFTQLGPQVVSLATVNGMTVAAREGKVLATSFHPELGEDTSVHELFLSMVAERTDHASNERLAL